MTVAHSKGRPGKRPNRSGFSEVYFRPDDLIDRPKRQLRQYTEEYTTSRKTADVPTESIQRDHYFLTYTQAGILMTFAKRPKLHCGRSRSETLFRRNMKLAGLTLFSPTNRIGFSHQPTLKLKAGTSHHGSQSNFDQRLLSQTRSSFKARFYPPYQEGIGCGPRLLAVDANALHRE